MNPDIDESSNPFPGLRPFDRHEAHLFFGRETQIDELLRRLRTQRFIAVVGTSGSGKSSLIRAGLFAALRVGAMSGAGSRWRIATMRPGNDPIDELAWELERAGLLGGDGDAELRVDLAYAILERGALGLVEIAKQMPVGGDENVLIVVDQFEELFRYAQTEENAAAAFVKLLLEVTAQPDLRAYVVLTMRSDFLGDCAAFADLPERINRGLYLVPRMTREQLTQAIAAPAKVAGAEIAPRLVNRLLNDVGDDPDQLPVLAHDLMLTYDFWEAEHEPGEPIDERAYRETGGLARAIDVHAERIYAGLTPAQQVVTNKLFAAITELGSDNRGIRRPLPFERLCAVCDGSEADVRAVVDAYRARTCSFLRPPEDVALGAHTVVDISHEALMRGWSRLRQLLAEEVESARIYRRLSDASALFANGEGGLLVDPALTLNLNWRDRFAPTAAWAERYGGNFAAAMTYLDRSRDERARAVAAQRSATRRRWTLAATVMTLLVFLTVASVASFFNAQRERSESLKAQSFFLARDADARIEADDPVTGMLIALEALPLSVAHPDRPYFARAATAVQYGMNEQREVRDLTFPNTFPREVLLSRDGKRFAAVLDDYNVDVFSRATYRLLYVLHGHTSDVTWMDFSSDGKYIVTSSWDRTWRIWNAANGRLYRLYHSFPKLDNAVFSPDGRSVLLAGVDGSVRIHSIATGAIRRTFQTPKQAVGDAEYSSDGRRVVSCGDDAIGRVWDVASGKLLYELRGHKAAIQTCDFAPSGMALVTASRDGTAIIWSAVSGALQHMLSSDGHGFLSAAFAPDSTQIVTAGGDKTARVWDARTGNLLSTLVGHQSYLGNAVFSPDGRRIVTAAADQTVRFWLSRPVISSVVLAAHTRGLWSVAYSPDGMRIVTTSADRTARLWDARTGALLRTFRGHADQVHSAEFSHDGRRIVTGSYDGSVRIWNLQTGASVRVFRARTPVFWAEFSPDDRRIAICDSDFNGNFGKIHVLDAASHNVLLVIPERVWTGFTQVVFSPDGTRIAAPSADLSVHIWNSVTGKVMKTLRGHRGEISSVQFSRDGRRLLTASALDGTIRIWDLATGHSLAVIEPGKGGIVDAQWSPDETEIVAGMSQERAVRIFDATTLGTLATLRGHTSFIDWVAFSPDGRHVVSGASDHTARIWLLPRVERCQQLIDDARNRLPRELTDGQRAAEDLTPRTPAGWIDPFASSDECR